MKKIIHKVPNGKLLRLEFEILENRLKNIKISGDFFIHPEEAIFDIEEFLKGKQLDQIESGLAEFLKIKNVTIIGFEPADLQKLLSA